MYIYIYRLLLLLLLLLLRHRDFVYVRKRNLFLCLHNIICVFWPYSLNPSKNELYCSPFEKLAFWLKPGLRYAIHSTFSPQLMCCKYFDECFMDKNLLHISFTALHKLNKRRKRTFLITQFENNQNIKDWFLLISKIIFTMEIYITQE